MERSHGIFPHYLPHNPMFQSFRIMDILTSNQAEPVVFRFQSFQGLWNVLTVWSCSVGVNGLFNPFRDYGTFSRKTFDQWFIKWFQSFQGLWTFSPVDPLCFERMHYVSIPFRDYGTFSRWKTYVESYPAWRFNPFQGLWNVLTMIEIKSYPAQAKVSIPFRDYGTFSPRIKSIIVNESGFQSLSGIMERSHGMDSPGRSWADSVSIPFRDYGTFSRIPTTSLA